jgi:hypothetical protein
MTIAMRAAAWLGLAATVLLGGCATATMTLSQDELRSIRIERVEVVYAPDVVISWDKVEYEYVNSIKAAQKDAKPWKQVSNDEKAQWEEHSRIARSPEGQAHIRGKLTDEFKRRMGETIVPQFQGDRPVILEVNLLAFSIPSPGERIMLGGAPTMGAITVLKDAKTGQELAKMDRATGAAAGNGILGVLVDQAFSDLEDRLFNAYIDQLREWMNTTRGNA